MAGQRTENWSWEPGGSVSRSHPQPYYRVIRRDEWIPAGLSGVMRVTRPTGGRQQPWIWLYQSLNAVLLQLVCGTAVDIQQAKDWHSSHLLLYNRYSAVRLRRHRRSLLGAFTLTGNHCVRPTN